MEAIVGAMLQAFGITEPKRRGYGKDGSTSTGGRGLDGGHRRVRRVVHGENIPVAEQLYIDYTADEEE